METWTGCLTINKTTVLNLLCLFACLFVHSLFVCLLVHTCIFHIRLSDAERVCTVCLLVCLLFVCLSLRWLVVVDTHSKQAFAQQIQVAASYVPTQLKHTLNTCACKTNHVMCLNEYSYILVHVCIRMMTQQHNYEYFVAQKKKSVHAFQWEHQWKVTVMDNNY